MHDKVYYYTSPTAKQAAELLDDWGCRCTEIALTEDEAKKRGIDDNTGAPAPKPAPPPDEVVSAPARTPDGRKVYAVGARQYVRRAAGPDKGMTVVVADMRKVDEAWAKDKGYYLPADKRGKSEVVGRREGFAAWARKGEPIEMPRVTVAKDGTLAFEDGRHRTAVLRDQGDARIALLVPRAQAERARKTLGVDASTPTWPDKPADVVKTAPEAKVKWIGGAKKTGKVAASILGQTPTPAQLRAIAGATPDAKVEVSAHALGTEMYVSSDSKRLTFQARITRDIETGERVAHIDWVAAPKKQTGGATAALARQIGVLPSLGIDKVRLFAAGSKEELQNGMQGYMVWPKFGFDGPLQADILAKLPREFRRARTVQDLFRMPGGADWWRDNGRSIALEFDVRPDSQSMDVWRRYLERKQAAVGQ
jgi:hypothetical protein